jgi:uncharacterized repeat protein (TIGR01451 family)
MSRPLILSALVFAFLLAGLAGQDARLVALALPLAAYLFWGLLHAPEAVNVEVARTMSAWRVARGEAVQVTLTLHNRGGDLEEVLVEDALPPGLQVVEGSHRHLLRLPAGAQATLSYTISGKRGYYLLHRVLLIAREPLGLVASTHDIKIDGQLFVVPPVLRLRHISIRPRRTRIFSGSIPARQGGSGLEFFDVRDYQAGDSSRRINWRLSARHDGLYSNQYEQERIVDVALILDGRANVNTIGDRSIFEYSVMATAALANAFLAVGNRVGMLFYGKTIRWTMPGYGKVQGEKILHDLSGLHPDGTQFTQELRISFQRFPVRSQLVLVSPLMADDFNALADLRARGYALLIISPDPVAFELHSGADDEHLLLALRLVRLRRQILLNRLRGIGIQVVNWDVAQPFEQVARRALERRPSAQVGRL